MSTKGDRSSGTQHNPRGATQGNTLVDPNTGYPISVITDDQGVRRLAVDANLTVKNANLEVNLDSADDQVAVEDPDTGAHIRVETNGSINVNVEMDAADGDNAFAVGSEDGTVTGTRHVVQVNPDLELVTREASTASIPTIYNVSAPLANTEVSQALPSNTKKFSIKVRNHSAILKLAFVSGQSGTNYITVDRGNTHEVEGIKANALTLYFQVNNPSQTIEILAWS